MACRSCRHAVGRIARAHPASTLISTLSSGGSASGPIPQRCRRSCTLTRCQGQGEVGFVRLAELRARLLGAAPVQEDRWGTASGWHPCCSGVCSRGSTFAEPCSLLHTPAGQRASVATRWPSGSALLPPSPAQSVTGPGSAPCSNVTRSWPRTATYETRRGPHLLRAAERANRQGVALLQRSAVQRQRLRRSID